MPARLSATIRTILAMVVFGAVTLASAVAQEPPLADGRLLPRLADELAQMYAAPLCLRLQPYL